MQFPRWTKWPLHLWSLVFPGAANRGTRRERAAVCITGEVLGTMRLTSVPTYLTAGCSTCAAGWVAADPLPLRLRAEITFSAPLQKKNEGRG
jgi:hypothetical protein